MKVLFVSGMHHSGTSVCAGWLHRSGLHMGHRLTDMDAGYYPQFEDLDFQQLHINWLREASLDHMVKPTDNIPVSSFNRVQAEDYIRSKSNLNQWGAKDPRAILFQSQWRELLCDDLYWLCPFRHPFEVIYSHVYKGEKGKAKERAIKKGVRELIRYRLNRRSLVNLYAEVYLRYTREIVALYEAEPARMILVDYRKVQQREHAVEKQLAQFGFDINLLPLRDFWREGRSNDKKVKGGKLMKECVEVYEKLSAYAE